MGLRDTFKKSVRTVLDRLSGEYSAGAGEIQDPPAGSGNVTPAGEVKITRPRLNRPPGTKSGGEQG